jgi:DNA-binding transcriptional regulator LsrR (DeoR family)
MSAPDIRRRPTVAVAGGRGKIHAIKGVLASGLLHGLITDENTARVLVDEQSSQM